MFITVNLSCLMFSSRFLTIIRVNEKSIEILALQEIKINGKSINLSDGFVKVNSLDKINFLCDKCHIPHLYHILYPDIE